MTDKHAPEHTVFDENTSVPFPIIDPIDFAGYIRLCDAPFYESNDILNADDVGHKTALFYGKRLALLWNIFQNIQDPTTYISGLQDEIERLKAQNDRMGFMIENGLGWDDVKDDNDLRL